MEVNDRILAYIGSELEEAMALLRGISIEGISAEVYGKALGARMNVAGVLGALERHLRDLESKLTAKNLNG